MQEKQQGNLMGGRRLRVGVALAIVFCAGGWAVAGEAWDGSNLTIYGSSDPTDVYVKRVDNETLSAGWIKIGTELGCASLVAVDSTIDLSGSVYVGWEQSPGYTNTAGSTTAALTASLLLTNTALTCAQDFILGYKVQTSGPLSAEIGSNSVVTCRRIFRSANPNPTLSFTGGRMVFSTVSGYGYLCQVEGSTWNGGWPNGGITIRGDGAPIDVEVQGEKKLAGGWSIRALDLRGDGGFIKRGTGKLLWGWYTYGSNNGYMGLTVDYTGDTVIKAGGIELATPSSVEKKQITYKTAAASALKIEAGAWFDFAGNPASFLGVSGAGTLTNSSATATTLTLGSSGGDGEFSPAISGGPFDVVKTGAGTLTVTASFIDGNLYVSNGTVKVSAGTSLKVKDVRVEPYATLDVRGAHIECDVLSAPRSAHILWDADTVFDCTVDMDEDGSFAAGRYGFSGTLRKTGEGTLTLLGPCAKDSGGISVEGGTMVCKPASTWAGKYFRLKYYGDASKDTHTGVSFSEFALYGTDGNRVNEGAYSYTDLPAGPKQKYGGSGGIDDATQLAECEVAVWMPNHDGFFQHNSNPPNNAFDGKRSTTFRNTWYWNDSNQIVFRVTNSAPEVIGFSFTTDDHPERRPTQWKLWGSVDGAAWTPLADNVTNTDDAVTWTYLTNSTPDTARTEYNIYPLVSLAASPAYAPFGDVEVSVGSGATLDLESAEMSLSRLKVNLDAGAGTITRFTPAMGGTIDLCSSSPVTVGRTIPLSATEVSSPTNLKSWTVKVNGAVRSDLGVRWNDGVLRVIGGGLQLIFR